MSGDSNDVRSGSTSITAWRCPGDGSMRNSIGMLAGSVSRSVDPPSVEVGKAPSVPKLMCTTLRTARGLLVPPRAGTSRTTWLPSVR